MTSHLVYVAKSGDVVTSIVDGHVLMEIGKVVTVDINAVRADTRKISLKVKAELDNR